MLYVTTREDRDAYTAYRALHESRSADGGLFLPFRMQTFPEEELDALLRKPFHQTDTILY